MIILKDLAMFSFVMSKMCKKENRHCAARKEPLAIIKTHFNLTEHIP